MSAVDGAPGVIPTPRDISPGSGTVDLTSARLVTGGIPPQLARTAARILSAAGLPLGSRGPTTIELRLAPRVVRAVEAARHRELDERVLVRHLVSDAAREVLHVRPRRATRLEQVLVH